MTIDAAAESKPQIESLIKERIPVKSKTRHGIKETFKKKLASKNEELNLTKVKLESVEEERDTDALTELGNRRSFLKKIKAEAERIKRFGGKSTVVILDADKLKSINDNFGHNEGDKYLVSISDAIRSALRRGTDTAYRIGGDEFAILLTGSDIEGTEVMWEYKLNPEFLQRKIAISAGAAELNPDNVQFAIDKADSAMYGAKHEPTRRRDNLLFSYIDRKLLKNG